MLSDKLFFAIFYYLLDFKASLKLKNKTLSFKKFRFGWPWIWRALLLQRGIVLLIVLSTTVIYAVGLAIPICTQRAIDAITTAGSYDRLEILLGIAFLSTVIEGLALATRQMLLGRAVQHLENRMSFYIFLHFMRIRVEKNRMSVGDVLSRFDQIVKIRNFSLFQIPRMIFDVGGSIFALAAMYYYSFIIPTAVLIIAIIVRMLLRAPLKKLREQSSELVTVNATRQEVLSETAIGIDTIKASGLESSRIKIWAAATSGLIKVIRAGTNLNGGIGICMQATGRVLSLLVISFSAWGIIRGQLTVGQLIALQILFYRVIGPLLNPDDVFQAVQEANVAIGRIIEFLHFPIEKASISKYPAPTEFGKLRVSQLTYSYPGNSSHALDNVTLDLPRTGVVAIIGRNGCGKTTLIKIITGMQADYIGDVYIGDNDLRHFNPRILRRQFGTVLQDSVLFAGTIRSNVDQGGLLSDESVNEALDSVGAMDFVNALPRGIESVVEAGGRNFSGGQRQRLSLARAIASKRNILVLDEPTAFLDLEAAVALENRITAWGKDRLVILVTHNLSVVRSVHQIVMLEAGRLVGQGSHQELLSNTKEYGFLWTNYLRSQGAGVVADQKSIS